MKPSSLFAERTQRLCAGLQAPLAALVLLARVAKPTDRLDSKSEELIKLGGSSSRVGE
jgi:hypothetical protein